MLVGALAAAVLAACGGGSGGSGGPDGNGSTAVDPKTVSAGPGCELSYTLTQSPVLTGADPLLVQQWHLRNTGQSGGVAGEDLRALDAWALTRGAGVRVAVVDDAIEIVHPDLLPNLIADASRSYRAGNRGSAWPLPCTAAVDASGDPVDGHGTAVAGLVLGRDDNALGIAGVAPRASLVAFDALASGQDADIADALLRDNTANAIYQNSWGAPDDGSLHAAPQAFAAAIRSGIVSGRGGLGSLFVFPGGNGGCFAREKDSGLCQVDNANFDGFVTPLGVVAVCAVDHAGKRPWYGEPGANLLVCGPSSGNAKDVVTTTLKGAWRGDFSGTSASTPMVSGVIALMLAANPDLSWRDVRWILAQTARRNDPTDPGWEPAAVGPGFNHHYGFGTVDARAAVAASAGWTSVGGRAAMKTCALPERVVGATLPDPDRDGTLSPVTDAIDVAAAGCGITQVEYVEVRFTSTHTYSGDLRIRLGSPLQRTSRLAEPRICNRSTADFDRCGGFDGWTFGSSRHLGEPAAGRWTLEVVDTVRGDVGRLERWSLTLHGR
jgi:proprotein convertase subtilisin/kexin type 2